MEHLPEEILSYILSLLSSYREYDIAAKVCKRWKNIIEEITSKTDKYLEQDLCEGNVQWYELEQEETAKISPRHGTAVCYNDETRSVYVFGGTSVVNDITGFNDLLQLNMHTLKWVRPPTKGVIPPPLTFSIMVSYKNLLLLYSGLYLIYREPIGPGSSRFSNQLYVYNVIAHRWNKKDYLENECPPPMSSKAGCVMTHDTDLEMDAFYVLGESDFNREWSLWALDLQTFVWAKQTIVGEIIEELTSCSMHTIENTTYSSALLVTNTLLFNSHAYLLYKTDYNVWFCQKIPIPEVPKGYDVILSRPVLSPLKTRDTLAVFTVFSSSFNTLSLNLTISNPIHLSNDGLCKLWTYKSSPPSPNAVLDFSGCNIFGTFLLKLNEIGKGCKLEWVLHCGNEPINTSLMSRMHVKSGTMVQGRGEYIFIGTPRSHEKCLLPVYILRSKR